MEYSGAWGKLIHEKKTEVKNRDTVPLSFVNIDRLMRPDEPMMCRAK
jgi:hypothetical protein